jgi:hypothetical protein
MYRIAIDAPRRLVEVVLSGMLSVDEVGRYMSELRGGIDAAAIGNDYAITVDVSACSIQTQDVIQAMGARMATMPKARAIAIVSESALARMQIRRLFHQPYARVVATQDDALAWVLRGEEPMLGSAACLAALPT